VSLSVCVCLSQCVCVSLSVYVSLCVVCLWVSLSGCVKTGQRFADHLVNTTTQAALAIAYRNAVFKIVPMSLFNDQMVKIKEVALGKGQTLQQQTMACIEAFKDYKINQDEFLTIANLRRIDDITVDDIIGMRGIYTSLKEGALKKSDLLKKANGKSDLGEAEQNEKKEGNK